MMGRLFAALSCLVVLAGCGIQADSQPRSLEPDQLVIERGTSDDFSAVGGDLVFLVGPGEEQQLRAVARDASSTLELFEILFSGPNESEIDTQYFSSIPAESQVRSVRPIGSLLAIDINDAILELSGDSLVRAVAQIVFTAAGVEGIDTVRITVEGERVAWPTGYESSTTEPLRIYDFPGLAQSAQPDYPTQPIDA